MFKNLFVEEQDKFVENFIENKENYYRLVQEIHGINIPQLLNEQKFSVVCECTLCAYMLKKHVCTNGTVQYKLQCINCMDRQTQYIKHEELKNHDLIGYVYPFTAKRYRKFRKISLW